MKTEVMTSEEIKAWILSRDFAPLRCELPMDQQITLALRDMHFERLRVVQTPYHPVYRISARLGRLAPQSHRPVKIALRKMCRELGFSVRMSDIIAQVYHGRVDACFALIPPDAVPVEVQNDGEWTPEHLEQAA
jgi:hypothetical protein